MHSHRLHVAIHDLHTESGYSIAQLCREAGISRQAYYQYQKRQPQRQISEAINSTIVQTIATLYLETNGIYGYRQMCNEVNTALGSSYNHKRIYRLMRQMGLRSVTRIKTQQRVPHGEHHIAENILNREFWAEKMNQKWLTDITEFHTTDHQTMYLCAIIDLFDNSVIAYQFSEHQNTTLVKDTLTEAIERYPDATPLIHSDRGSQYTSYGFKALLKAEDMIQSMSRPGECIDNGPMESFFGKVKSERYHLKRKYGYYTSLEHIVDDITQYIHFYNYRRPQRNLFGVSPSVFRLMRTLNVA